MEIEGKLKENEENIGLNDKNRLMMISSQLLLVNLFLV